MVLQAAARDYFEYVRFGVCPVSGDYPDLKQCLNSEWQARASWLPHLRAGKTLTEAIELTVSERHGAWAWATSVVAAQYANVAGARETGTGDDESDGDFDPPVPHPSATKRQKVRGNSSKGGGRSKSASSTQPGVPALASRDGHTFCKDFNGGGCSKGVNCKKMVPELHACNYVDAAGKVCGRLGHRRCNHKDHALPKQ